MTPVRFSPSLLRQSRWHEYPVRFALGGLATVVSGLISDPIGAKIGQRGVRARDRLATLSHAVF
jgi:hypothetical protein